MFLYKLEDGVVEGLFGMYCVVMCGIFNKVIEEVEVVVKEWEYISWLKESLERVKMGCYIFFGVLSDVVSLFRVGGEVEVQEWGVEVLL